MARQLEIAKATDNKAMDGKKDRGRYTKTGLYFDVNLSQIDARTRIGKMIKFLKKELREYAGNGTTASELLIHRIIYKTIKLSLYETNQLLNPENPEAAHYLPMANSLRLDLQALADVASKAPSQVPSLGDFLNG